MPRVSFRDFKKSAWASESRRALGELVSLPYLRHQLYVFRGRREKAGSGRSLADAERQQLSEPVISLVAFSTPIVQRSPCFKLEVKQIVPSLDY